MYPSCLKDDCATWGTQKAYDGKETGLTSLAHTAFGNNPYIQLDLGSTQNIDAVRIVARADCCLTSSQSLAIYLSSGTTDFATSANLCARGVGASALGESFTALCTPNLSGRYLTIQLQLGIDMALNLQEIVPLTEGG